MTTPLLALAEPWPGWFDDVCPVLFAAALIWAIVATAWAWFAEHDNAGLRKANVLLRDSRDYWRGKVRGEHNGEVPGGRSDLAGQ